ncbi:hypothetical protein CLOM_g8182, partial [Closterium sp. NIES-68]
LLLRHPGFRHSQEAIRAKILRLKVNYEKLRDQLERLDWLDRFGSPVTDRLRMGGLQMPRIPKQLPEWFLLLDPVMSRSQGRTSALLLNSARAAIPATAVRTTRATAAAATAPAQSAAPEPARASAAAAARGNDRPIAGPVGTAGRLMCHGSHESHGRDVSSGRAGSRREQNFVLRGREMEFRGEYVRARAPARAGPDGLSGGGRKRGFEWRGREVMSREEYGRAHSPARAEDMRGDNGMRGGNVTDADDVTKVDEPSAAVLEGVCADFEDVMQDWAGNVCAEFEESVVEFAESACFRFKRLTEDFAESWKAGRGTKRYRM